MGRPRAKVKRGFGEVGQRPSGRYRARYTGPDGGRHSASITFDAEGWLVDQERMISCGEWEPPARQVREVHEAPLLLGEYAATVVARRRIRPGGCLPPTPSSPRQSRPRVRPSSACPWWRDVASHPAEDR